MFDAIPSQITLPDSSIRQARFVSLEKQIPKKMDVVAQYYELFNSVPERQYVPMIIIGQKALFLKEEIVPSLLADLLAAMGSTPTIHHY